MMNYKRALSAIMFSVLLSACGLVDTEAAGEAVALKEQVLRIQTEQLDPLLDQLSGLKSDIEPLEEEIDDLESQRDELVDQGRDLAGDFEREMQDKFQLVYQDEDEARRHFENDLQDQFKDLEKKRRDIERGSEEKWADVEVQAQALFNDVQKEMDAKRFELESTYLDSAPVSPVEIPHPEIDQPDEIRSTPELDAVEEQSALLRTAQNSLNKMRSELQLYQMELEERSFDLEDQMAPVYEQLEDLWRKQETIWENESSKDFNFLRQEAYDQIRNIQNDLQAAWEAEEDAAEVDWNQREQRRAAAEEQHSASLQSINEQRSAAYVQADQSDIGAAAEKGISSLSEDYDNSRRKYQNLIVEVDARIEAMGGGSESGQESAGELRAKLESTRLQYQEVNDLLGTLDSKIRGGEESNPEYATAKQAHEAASLTLQLAQETLANTAAEIEGTAAPVMIANPAYLAAQTAVADAQQAVTDAQQAVTDAQQAVTDATLALDSATLALDSAQLTLANTPEKIVGDSAPDQPINEVDNPNYAAAQTAVADAQQAVTDAQQAVTDLQFAAIVATQALDLATPTFNEALVESESIPLEIEFLDPDNPAVDLGMVANPAYLIAQTAVDDAQQAIVAAESALATTPETLITEDKPNPAYEAAKNQAASLQASVRSLELQQSTAPADAPAAVNPDLTAAYAEKLNMNRYSKISKVNTR